MGMSSEDVERLDSIVKRSRPLHRGDHLFRGGDAFRCLFAVKTGSIKSYVASEDGTEQVLGFHLPGELIGLSAIQSGFHCNSAKVLETTAVCEIPFDRLEELTASIPGLQRQMYRIMSKEIVNDTDMLLLLGKKSADERLAAFLLSLSERFHKRGFSATEFNLSMSRHDIGSYLGLAVETVSRLFTRFQEDGLVRVERRHIELLDLERLHAILEHGQRDPQLHCR
jgi:CRP/FNR family transcriptional regulator